MDVKPITVNNTQMADIYSNFFGAFKIHGATLTGLFGAWLFDAMDATIYAYAVPSIVKDLNVTITEAFSVVSVFLICTAIGGILISNISDKIGRKPTILLSVLLYGIANFLCGRAETLTELYLYRGLVGFGLGGLWPAAMALISEIWPATSRGVAVATLQTGWCFGLLAAALFAFTIIPQFGWRGMFYATIVPTVVVFFVVLFFVKESDIWLARKQKQANQAVKSAETVPLLKLFNAQNLRNTVIGVGVSTFGMYGWWTLFTFLPTYIDRTLKLGITKGAEFMIWTSLGALFGYMTFGLWADRYGRRPLFAIFFIAMALVIPLFLYAINASGLAYLPLIGIVLGYFTGYYSGYGALFSELYSTDVRATGAGFCYNVGRAAVFVGPLLISYLIPKVGFDMAIGSASLSFIIAAALVLMLRETKGTEITA